jgi:hypothetical protein
MGNDLGSPVSLDHPCIGFENVSLSLLMDLFNDNLSPPGFVRDLSLP